MKKGIYLFLTFLLCVFVLLGCAETDAPPTSALTSYTTPTSKPVYNVESDPYQTLVDYIKENGEYYSSTRRYVLYLGSNYTSDNQECMRMLSYYPDDGDISYNLVILDYDMQFYFYIDEADGIYEYWFWDTEYAYYVTGTIYASTFDSADTLPYTQSNLPTSSIFYFRSNAALSLDILCDWMEDDLFPAGLKPSDLGFIYYD